MSLSIFTDWNHRPTDADVTQALVQFALENYQAEEDWDFYTATNTAGRCALKSNKAGSLSRIRIQALRCFDAGTKGLLYSPVLSYNSP